MKKNKKIILIITLILLILMGLILYLVVNKKDIVIKPKVEIVDKKSFLEYQYKDIFNDYFIVVKDKLGAIDKNGNVLIDFIYSPNSYILKSEDAIIIRSDDMDYLYDKNLNLVKTASEITFIKDPVNQEMYY